MKKSKPYEPFSASTDKYYDLLDALTLVFKKHFAHCHSFQALGEASRFLGCYESWMMAFWTGDQARKELDKLEKALRQSVVAYNALPAAVRDGLHGNAQQWDYFAKNRFLASTNLNFVFVSDIPQSEAETVSTGLNTFAENPDDFLKAIEVTRKRLPEGIPTRNRAVQKWALIEATVELVRAHEAMNVPKSIDQSGDLGRLLAAVFDVFGIKVNSFRQLFDSWREHIDSKRETFDLLSMED